MFKRNLMKAAIVTGAKKYKVQRKEKCEKKKGDATRKVRDMGRVDELRGPSATTRRARIVSMSENQQGGIMSAPAYGVSVTQRINGVPRRGIPAVKQPRGGYIKPKSFECVELPTTQPLHDYKEENIHPSLVGLAVDYLTRFTEGSPIDQAFKISIIGATQIGEIGLCQALLGNIKGLDDASIIAACQVVGFDTVYRAGAMTYKPVRGIEPNAATIENIREMVSRSQSFFEKYGPVVIDGMTFEGGYTATIVAGDGDFMTADTLWDFKVSVKPPTNKHTLQALIYWRLGLHSVHPEYQQVKNLGFFNPRLGTVYLLAVDKIPTEVIAEVENEVIGY